MILDVSRAHALQKVHHFHSACILLSEFLGVASPNKMPVDVLLHKSCLAVAASKRAFLIAVAGFIMLFAVSEALM